MRKQSYRYMILAVWALLPSGLVAQEVSTVLEGDHVRVSATEFGQPCTGQVVERSVDALTVDCWQPAIRKWQLIDYPIESIRSIEVQQGTKSNAGKGAVLGGLVGGGFGLALGVAAAVDDCPSNAWTWDWCWWSGGEEMIPLSTATFGLLGAGVGAVIGSLSRTDKWVPIRPNQLSARVQPLRGGFALAITVAN